MPILVRVKCNMLVVKQDALYHHKDSNFIYNFAAALRLMVEILPESGVISNSCCFMRLKISRETLMIWGLIFLFSVMMSLPFLLPGCSWMALVGFVPLLCAERLLTLTGRRCTWIYLYVAFVLWNAFTTFWVCNATVGGGIAAIMLNSLQMLVVFLIFRGSRCVFRGILPYILLAAGWIAWEKAYFNWDISWPWLVLGNSFARTPSLVQWYDVTGTLGGSLWVWVCNLGVFGLLVCLSDGEWFGRRLPDGRWIGFSPKARVVYSIGLFLVFLGPVAWSLSKWFSPNDVTSDTIDVLVAQPNIDPYNKFSAMTQAQQNALVEQLVMPELIDYKRAYDRDSTWCGNASEPGLLILAPETFTSDVTTNFLGSSPTLNRFKTLLAGYLGVNMLLGASTYTRVESDARPSLTSRQITDGLWYESHNSAIMIDGSGRDEIFHKTKLVVAVEKLPYPRVFDPIDRALGGVMGRCIGQDEISLLHFRASDRLGNMRDIPLGCAVCYESVYGDYCRGYILKGARALTIITNDAWWGDTPGYHQHLSYASLRAIETRRAIARCGNTGISGLIDNKGRIVEQGPWWKPVTLHFQLPLSDDLTFFVTHGDITGRLCTFTFLLLLAALFVRTIVNLRGTGGGF